MRFDDTRPPFWATPLAGELEGELDCSALARRLYGQDASIYEQYPLGVARPRNLRDCQTLVRRAVAERFSLIARGGGTSLAGQCVGAGLVVEFTRHMNRILELDPAGRRARVQAGVIQDDLNDDAAVHGLMFAPDTSTSRQATVGGMIGNNSCGAFSVRFGTTRDHVESVEVVLSDGSTAEFGPIPLAELEARRRADTFEGRLIDGVLGLVDRHRDAILAAAPKPGVRRRNAGYALDALATGQPWNPGGPPFNLARLVCGSEGTLALVASAVVRLVPRPRGRRLMCVHFDSVTAACDATPDVLRHDPVAVELMDGALLEATGHHPQYARDRFWVVGHPGAVLAVEFWDDDEAALDRRLANFETDLRARNVGYAWPVVPADRIARVWALRKAGLGLLTGIPGDAKPVTAIEDIAVAPEDLGAFVRELDELLGRLGCSCVHYGHASVGLLHYRPMLNLRDPRDLERFVRLMEEVIPLVRRYGGSLSGEHGDGRLRAPYLRAALGAELYDLCVQVKRLFDPAGVLNPGKIVDAPPVTADLRTSPATPTPDLETEFDWSRTEGFLRAAEACNGAAVCRQGPGRGLMCPTYMATGDEAHTTRARANLLRQTLTANDGSRGWWRDPELASVMDTCIACKGCRAECPSGVDMARMKAEWAARRNASGLPPLRSLVFGHMSRLARLARLAPALASRLAADPRVKRLLGIAAQRSLPAWASTTFSEWFRRRRPNDGPKGEVVLFADEFVEYLEPAVGIAAVEFMETAGWRVHSVGGLESGRAQISKGFLRSARRALANTVWQLAPYARRGLPIVGLEPSALLGLRDEALDLLPNGLRSEAEAVRDAARLFPEWVAEQAEAGRLAGLRLHPLPCSDMLLHGHCHQKALGGTEAVRRALQLIPGLRVIELPTACCGMAGSFGYEAEHYELSMRMGELVLFPAIRARPEAAICADGASCRQQIAHGTGRVARHCTEWLRSALTAAVADGPSDWT